MNRFTAKTRRRTTRRRTEAKLTTDHMKFKEKILAVSEGFKSLFLPNTVSPFNLV